MTMRCANRLGPFSYCMAEIPEDSDYEVTQDGTILCVRCVDRLFIVRVLPDDLRELEHLNKGKRTKKSAPCELGKVKSVLI